MMPNSGAASPGFPAAPRAAFRTSSPLISPTHFREEPLLKVAGGRAEYERRLLRPPAGHVTERGTGTVSSTGEVSLTSSTGDQTLSYEATYRGQIDGKLLRLSGVQIWQLPDKANHKRPCTIAVSRSE